MQCYGVPRALPSSTAADGSWDVAVRRGEPLLCLLVAPAVSVGFPGRIISGSCPSVVRSRKALILILFSKKQDGGGQKMSSGEQNEWSVAWILFCSSFFFFFFSFAWSLCVHISVCIIHQPLAEGIGNCKKLWQKAGSQEGRWMHPDFSSPPSLSPCADGLLRVQLCFAVLWLSTKSYLFALSVIRKHIRNSHWSGPPSAEHPNYWQLLSIKLHSLWKQQEREMGLEQNQNMSRHW